jgi:hypothetical protein
LEHPRDGAAQDPSGNAARSHHGSGSNGGTGRRAAGGVFGPLLRLAGTGLRTDSDTSTSKPKTPKSPKPQARGWGRVRKLVLEDKALEQLKEEI